MTAFLFVIVVLVGLIALVDLTLTYALIRRVNAIQSHPHLDSAFTPKPGHQIGTFVASATSGHEVTDQDLEGRTTLVAFVMPKCSPCEVLTDELSRMAQPDVPLWLFVAQSRARMTKPRRSLPRCRSPSQYALSSHSALSREPST